MPRTLVQNNNQQSNTKTGGRTLVQPEKDYMKGGLLSKFADVLNTPQYISTGIIESGKDDYQAPDLGKFTIPTIQGGKKEMNFGQLIAPSIVGAYRGLTQTRTPSEAMNLKGVKGLAADVILDPMNIAPGASLLSKGAKSVGATKTASKLNKLSKTASLLDPFSFITKKTVVPVAEKGIDLFSGIKGLGKATTKGNIGGLSTIPGVPGGGKRFSGQLSEAFKPIKSRLDDLFKNADDAGKTVQTDDILEIVDPYIKDLPAGDRKSGLNAIEKVVNDLSDSLGSNPSVKLANKERQKVGGAIGKKWQSMTEPLKTKAQKDAYFKLRDMVEEAAPGTNKLLEEFEPLSKLNKALVEASKKPNKIVDWPRLMASLTTGTATGGVLTIPAYLGLMATKGKRGIVSAGQSFPKATNALMKVFSKAGQQPE